MCTNDSGNLFWRVISVSILSCMLILNGCTTLTLKPYVRKRVDLYENHQMKNGLVIAAIPMTDPIECKKYFGMDLLSKSVLPVFITIENKSVSSSFSILKESIKLIDEKTVLCEADKNAGKNRAEGGAVVAWTGAFLVSLPLLFAGAKMISDSTVIKHSISSQEFQTRTLSPEEKASGFLYFQIPENNDNVNVALQINAIEPLSKEFVAFNIPMDLNANHLSIEERGGAPCRFQR